MREDPSFTYGNYLVCEYCTFLIRGRHRDGSNDGCKLVRRDDGKYARLVLEEEKDLIKEMGIENDYIVAEFGCDKFKPSGVPIHPKVLEVLISNNKECGKIPIDSNAMEDSYEFYDKVNTFLPKENMVSFEMVE